MSTTTSNGLLRMRPLRATVLIVSFAGWPGFGWRGSLPTL